MKQAEIATLLPGVFQRAIRPGTPLAALLAVMEAQHAPVEALLVELDGYFDPYRAPDLFVTLLAGWVDLDRLFAAPPEALDEANIRHLYGPGLGRLRELVAAAAYLSRWRGTAGLAVPRFRPGMRPSGRGSSSRCRLRQGRGLGSMAGCSAAAELSARRSMRAPSFWSLSSIRS